MLKCIWHCTRLIAALCPCGVRHIYYLCVSHQNSSRVPRYLFSRLRTDIRNHGAANENIPHEEVFRGCTIFGIFFDSWLAQQDKEIGMRCCPSVASSSIDSENRTAGLRVRTFSHSFFCFGFLSGDRKKMKKLRITCRVIHCEKKFVGLVLQKGFYPLGKALKKAIFLQMNKMYKYTNKIVDFTML